MKKSSIDRENDADLIVEAQNVLHESGLTPRELLTQRDELLTGLQKFIADTRRAHVDGEGLIMGCPVCDRIIVSENIIERITKSETKQP